LKIENDEKEYTIEIEKEYITSALDELKKERKRRK
jgi:hypothetical protein